MSDVDSSEQIMLERRRQRMKAVIFDMDGLMIDSEILYWEAARRLARSLGREVTDQTLGRMMGRSPIDSMRVFATELALTNSPGELLAAREAEVFARLSRGVNMMPGLMQVLDELGGRYVLGIATSAPLKIVEVILGQLGVRNRFKAVQTSDDVVEGKPGPEIYLKAMKKLHMEPEQCVVLEDSSNGAMAGKRAGAYVIAVPSDYTRAQDFSFVDYVAVNLLAAAGHLLGNGE